MRRDLARTGDGAAHVRDLRPNLILTCKDTRNLSTQLDVVLAGDANQVRRINVFCDAPRARR